MTFVKEIAAYVGLVRLAACLVCAAIVAAKLTGGVLGVPAGAAAAVLTFLSLRRVTGRIVAAASTRASARCRALSGSPGASFSGARFPV
jgi:hypothetical protein